MRCADMINIISGMNGSGKTSILEAISLLSCGRSFRSKIFSSVIQDQQDYLSVFATASDTTLHTTSHQKQSSLGVYLAKSKAKIMHIDRRKCLSAAVLAKVLPVKVIAPHCFGLLDHGPKERRKYFDWLTFYLCMDFAATWKEYHRCLEQRNSLLKRSHINHQEMAFWDKQLITLSLLLQDMRTKAFSQLLPVIMEIVAIFGLDQDLSIQLFPGWNPHKEMHDCLHESFHKDRLYGRTTQGAHHCDLLIKHGHLSARDKLSRGQKKILIYVLHIAQAVLLQRRYQIKCIFLLDDLMSELDDHFSYLVYQYLCNMAHQFFITTTDWQRLTRLNLLPQDLIQKNDVKVFHVKHGVINEQL